MKEMLEYARDAAMTLCSMTARPKTVTFSESVARRCGGSVASYAAASAAEIVCSLNMRWSMEYVFGCGAHGRVRTRWGGGG